MPLTAQQVVAELVERGLDPAVAEGIAMSIRDESGFDPGINEANPIVPGSRGGYGMIQWTGPRRDELEAYAAAQGTSVDDPEMQFDNLMRELETSEKATMAALEGVDDPGQAAAIFTEKFLRPAPEHLARRKAQYLGGDAGLDIDAAALPAAGLQEPEVEVDPDWERPTQTGLGGLAASREYTNPNTGEEGKIYADHILGRLAKKSDAFKSRLNDKGMGVAGNMLTQFGQQLAGGYYG